MTTRGEEQVLRDEGFAQLLFKIGYIERWNTGVERIRRQMRERGLNARQVEAVRLMVNEGEEVTNGEYREMFDVTARTALRDLKGLLEADQVRQVGQGRSVGYVAG